MPCSVLTPSSVSKEKYLPYILLVVFIGTLLVGLRVLPDYGVTFDEEAQRYYGQMVYEYVVEGNQHLFTYVDRFYGPFFEFVLYATEKLRGLKDLHDVVEWRHELTFLSFLGGALGFYGVARRLFRNGWLALLGVVFLFLSPRMFAEAFYNSKDIPLLAAFTIAMWTLLLFRERPTVRTLLLHALACAVATDIRLVGALTAVFTVVLLSVDAADKERQRSARPGVIFILFLLSTALLVTLLWPTLWRNPVSEFARAVSRTAHYPWSGIVFFRRRYILATRLPRYYLPLWIFITTPLLYLVLGVVGLVASARSLARTRHFSRDVSSLLPLLWFFVPVAMVVALRPTLYDGWRQLYFVYPALLLLSLRGFEEIRVSLKSLRPPVHLFARVIAFALVAAALGNTVAFMVRNHPLQNLFFSAIAGGIRGADGRFELDYWGPSYKQAIEQVLGQDSRPVINASFHNQPGELNVEALPPDLRKRVRIVPIEEADYFFTNFRDQYLQRPPYPEAASVRVDGVKVLSVYRVH